jgi:deoxyribodipyrimidine photo-lyase
MICPPDRAAAFCQLVDFMPRATAYGRDRNFVDARHAAVSRLSPAIRHRLITEDEIAAAVLEAHPLPKVEKFIQEIYWRKYWKCWLSLRPEVWRNYRKSLEDLLQAGGESWIERAKLGRMGNSVINHFCHELVSTGYLHNHARMWFAGWWIHEARLPWELGAEFFHRHLLDGDPASNTLSWRWVAGLQTPGKTYLTRRSNLEKYLAPELATALQAGLPAFENPSPQLPAEISAEPVTRELLECSSLNPSLPAGLWIHEEDLTPESSPAAGLEFRAVLVAGHTVGWRDFPEMKRAWLERAMADASARATASWQVAVELSTQGPLVEMILAWAQSHQLRQVVALRPEVGALADALHDARCQFAAAGVRLVYLDRPRDVELRPLASGGFFKFWQKMQKRELVPVAAPRQLRFDM